MMLRQRVMHMWRTGQYIKPADSGFHPRQIYVPGVPGPAYRPRDLSTLFLDYPPTSPVTAMEQQVACMLDISGNGHHAFQTTLGKRPVVSRRVNLLTESEFRNGGTDAPVRAGLLSVATLPGYLGAIAFGHDGVTWGWAYKTFVSSTSVTYVLSVVVKMDDGNAPSFVGSVSDGSNTFTLVVAGAPKVPSAYVVTSLGDGLYRVAVSGVGSGANSTFGVTKYPGNNSRTFKVTAYDLRLATDAHLPYQRVNTATDYDDNAFKFPTYLLGDGAATIMQTGNIDLTGTDKMTVIVGVTALDMGAAVRASGVIAGSNFGGLNGFAVVAPNNAGITSCASSGNLALAQAAEASLGGAPRSMVLTLLGDQSVPFAINRRDGVQRGINAATQGASGGYGNRPLNLFGDPANRYFSGRIYGLLAPGIQMTPAQLAASEAWMAAEMMLPA